MMMVMLWPLSVVQGTCCVVYDISTLSVALLHERAPTSMIAVDERRRSACVSLLCIVTYVHLTPSSVHVHKTIRLGIVRRLLLLLTPVSSERDGIEKIIIRVKP